MYIIDLKQIRENIYVLRTSYYFIDNLLYFPFVIEPGEG